MNADLFCVIEIDADGYTTNRWEYLTKDDAEALKATLARGSNKDMAYEVKPQLRLNRAEIVAELSKLFSYDHLPVPWQILFDRGEDDNGFSLTFNTAAEVEAWARVLGGNVRSGTYTPGSLYTFSDLTWLGHGVRISASEQAEPEPSTDPADAAAEVPEELAADDAETLRQFPCLPVYSGEQDGGPFCDNYLCKGACGRPLLVHGRPTTDPEPTPAAGTSRSDIAGAGER